MVKSDAIGTGSRGTPSVVSSLNMDPAIRSSPPTGAGRLGELTEPCPNAGSGVRLNQVRNRHRTERPTRAGLSRRSLATICSMRRAVGLLLVAILFAGCGNQSAPEKGMDAKFDKLDYTMATYETSAAQYNNSLAKTTQQYIALVRESADQLGPDEARRRLVEKGDEVGSYCVPCAGTLYDEARKY
jgi:hypothetical protein